MLHDLLMAWRRAVRAPLLSLTLVGVLAVGIGATATMVSVLDTLLWRPVAMPSPGQLVKLTTVGADGELRYFPLPLAEGLTRASLPVRSLCAFSGPKIATRVDGRFLQANAAYMTAGCADVTGVPPIMGRWFTATEAPLTGRGQALAVITDRFWKRMFDSAPQVLGRAVDVEEGRVTVVGVLPPRFDGFDKDTATDIIMPFGAFEPSGASWMLFGRLQPGSSLDALRARLGVVWPGIVKDKATSAPNPAEASHLSVLAEPGAAGWSVLGRLYAPTLRLVTALALLLLALTCINASGLLATKVASHQDEIASMRALGASGWRIARQIVAEAVVVVGAGAALGVAIAFGATRTFPSLLPWGIMPWTIDFTPDTRVLAAVAASCVVVTLLVATVPVWLATRGERFLQGRRAVTRRTSRWGNAMLVVQLATTIVLLFACALLVRSFTGLTHVDRGFRPERLLSVRVLPTPGGHRELNQQEYYPKLLSSLAALQGVESAGFARYFGTIYAQLPPEPVDLVSSAPLHTVAALEYVSPNFFATIGTPILRGRDVAWSDRPDTTKVALVSASLAHDLDAQSDVVGRSIDFGADTPRQRLQIVGVVGDISVGNYRENAVKLVFVPAVQANEATYPTFQLRTSGNPLSLVPAVTKVVETAGREYVQRVAHVDDMFSNGLVEQRMAAVVSTWAAILGTVLAALGLYALLTHSVAARSRELGVRLALGATPRDVGGLILRHMLQLALASVVVGAPAALLGSRILKSLMFGVSTGDRVTLALAVGTVVLAGLAASTLPIARARRVDPVDLLRVE